MTSLLHGRMQVGIKSTVTAIEYHFRFLKGEEEYREKYSYGLPKAADRFNTKGAAIFGGEHGGFAEVWWVPLFVIRYDDAESVVEEALKAGELERTGENILGKPVFFFGDREKGRKYHVYLTPTQEVLVAEKVGKLRRMVSAGMGLEPNILDSADILPLLDHYPDLGHYWIFHVGGLAQRCFIKTRIEQGLPKNDFADMQESIENGMQYSITTTLITDMIIKREIRVYGSEEEARKWAEKIREPVPLVNKQLLRYLTPEMRARVGGENTPQEIIDLHNKREAAKKVSREGTVVTMEYDKELLRAMKLAAEARDKLERDKGRNKEDTNKRP